VDSTTSDSHPPHPMEHNNYRAIKCDAVDRIMDFGSDLVYATVNAIIFLELYYKTYTNSALGFCGSSPTTTNPQVFISSFTPWSNVHAVLRLSGNVNTNSGVITLESDNRSASQLSPNADFNPSVTTCNDHSAAVGYCDTGGAAPCFALFTPVRKFYVAAWSLMQSVIQLWIVSLPLMLTYLVAQLLLNEPWLIPSMIERCDMPSQVLRSIRTLLFLILSVFKLWCRDRSIQYQANTSHLERFQSLSTS
jgi:hypothetical protein